MQRGKVHGAGLNWLKQSLIEGFWKNPALL